VALVGLVVPACDSGMTIPGLLGLRCVGGIGGHGRLSVVGSMFVVAALRTSGSR